MARGTKLKDALVMLKGELGISTAVSTGTGSDQELMSLINTQQQWLAGEYDWPFLRAQEDVEMWANERFGLMPATIDFEKPVRVDTWSQDGDWHQLEFGITADEYNRESSAELGGVAAETMLNITHWDMRAFRPDTNETNPPPPYPTQVFEVWPLSSVDHVIRFTGKRAMRSLRDVNGKLNGEAVLELDDILVVFYAAYKKLSRSKKEDASFVLAQAEKRFNSLRAAQPSRDTPIVLGGPYYYYRPRNILAGNGLVTTHRY